LPQTLTELVRLFGGKRVLTEQDRWKNEFETCGTETVRTILHHGWANRGDYSEVIQQIAVQSSPERKAAIAWLKTKDARNAFQNKLNMIVTVIAAVAAVLAAIFSYLALKN
jgi:hypothetical protein